MKQLLSKKTISVLIGLTAFVGLIWFICAVRGILLPFVLAFVLAYALHPVAEKMVGRRWPRSMAVGTLVIGLCCITVLIGMIFVPILQAQVLDFIRHVPQLSARVWNALKGVLEGMKDTLTQQQMAELADSVNESVMTVLTAVGAGLSHVLSGGVAVFQVLGLILITPVVLFYVLKDWPVIQEKIGGLMPKKYEPQIQSLWQEINRTLSGFIRGQTLVCLCLALYYGIGLTLIGWPYGILIGPAMGLLAFVPYVGFGSGLILSVFLGLIQGMSAGHWLALAVVFGVGQILEGYILTPKLVGKRVGLHPVWIIFALLAGGILMGFLGVLIAVPAAAVIGVLVRRAVARYQAGDFYRGKRPS